MDIKKLYNHVIQRSDFYFKMSDEMRDSGDKDGQARYRTLANELESIYLMIEELPEFKQIKNKQNEQDTEEDESNHEDRGQ